MERKRSSSEPSSPQIPKTDRPISLVLEADSADHDEPFRARVEALSPILSPTRLDSDKVGEWDSRLSSQDTAHATTTLPRKVSSSIRRRLSGRNKGSTNQRRSTSDVPDNRFRPPSGTDQVRTNKGYQAPRGAQPKKRSFFKMVRSNSLRKETETSQPKQVTLETFKTLDKKSSTAAVSTEGNFGMLVPVRTSVDLRRRNE